MDVGPLDAALAQLIKFDITYSTNSKSILIKSGFRVIEGIDILGRRGGSIPILIKVHSQTSEYLPAISSGIGMEKNKPSVKNILTFQYPNQIY